jgi:hypothetical protein
VARLAGKGGGSGDDLQVVAGVVEAPAAVVGDRDDVLDAHPGFRS